MIFYWNNQINECSFQLKNFDVWEIISLYYTVLWKTWFWLVSLKFCGQLFLYYDWSRLLYKQKP